MEDGIDTASMACDYAAELEHAQISVRVALTKALRLDDSHGPMPASMDFIVRSVDAVVRVAAGPSAKLMSEPMVQSEVERLRARVEELEAQKDADFEMRRP